mgnify:CR=1 FL=1
MATNSIVDYLSSAGKDSSYVARQALATKMGIQNYTGSASQNTQLLNTLRNLLTKPETAPKPLATPTSQAFGSQPFVDPRQLPQQPAQQAQQTATRTFSGAGGTRVSPPQQEQQQQSNYQKVFDDTILAMMKAAQGAGDEDLQEKRNAIINARFNSSKQTTPEELRVLSPQAQSNLRSLDSAGLEEQLGGISAALKGRQAQRASQIETGEKLLKYLKPEEQKHSPAYVEWQDVVSGGYKGSFNEYQTLDANRKRSISNTYINAGGYSSAQEKAITKLNDSVSKNATYQKTSNMRTFGDNVRVSLSQKNGLADIAAINQFQKVIDEGAVTRDQDVILIRNAQSLVNSLLTKVKKLAAGDQLSETQRNQMITLVDSVYNAQVKALLKDPYIKSKESEAIRNGFKIEDTILGELGSFDSTPNTSVKPANTTSDPLGIR